jgi:hypothetical protein
MTHPKVQHYVPDFLLRNFCAPTAKGRKVFVFDKVSRASFPTNTKNIVCESKFYDFEHEGSEYSLEPTLSNIEALARPIVAELITRLRIPRSSDYAEQMAAMALFIAVQLARTPWHRDRLAEMPALLAQHLKAMNEQWSDQIDELLKTPDPNAKKREGSIFLLNWARRATPILVQKHWLLLTTDRRSPFLIGDNPVARTNQMSGPPPFERGNTGIASTGVEIYLPLSSTVTLALFCDSVVDQIIENAGRLSAMPAHSVRSSPDLTETKAKLDTFCHALNSGEAVRAHPENVRHLNSLQVIHAERFLISSSSDFRLAQEMLTNYPELRVGPRITVA